MNSALQVFVVMFVTLVLSHETNGKIYDQCELARDLHYRFGFSRRHVLPNWICLIEAESTYNTRARHRNSVDGSTEYGLFQISSRYWCDDGFPNGKNTCGVKCKDLLSDNIKRAVSCAKIIHSIHGYAAWVGWNNECNGRPLPLLDHCFEQFGNNNLAYAGWSKEL